MSDYQIEDGFPIPENKLNKKTRKRYPFDEMVPGQSFFVNSENKKSAIASSYEAAKRLGCKFVWDKENGGIRVWKVDCGN